jgi:hypothetical protein
LCDCQLLKYVLLHGVHAVTWLPRCRIILENVMVVQLWKNFWFYASRRLVYTYNVLKCIP